jgi:hypothetical protein
MLSSLDIFTAFSDLPDCCPWTHISEAMKKPTITPENPTVKLQGSKLTIGFDEQGV